MRKDSRMLLTSLAIRAETLLSWSVIENEVDSAWESFLFWFCRAFGFLLRKPVIDLKVRKSCPLWVLHTVQVPINAILHEGKKIACKVSTEENKNKYLRAIITQKYVKSPTSVREIGGFTSQSVQIHVSVPNAQ